MEVLYNHTPSNGQEGLHNGSFLSLTLYPALMHKLHGIYSFNFGVHSYSLVVYDLLNVLQALIGYYNLYRTTVPE